MKNILAKYKQLNISAKLIISYSLVIIMFLAVVVYSLVVIVRVDTLYRYRIHELAARNELLLEYHQEFTEFRRLLKASYYHPGWSETVNNATRRLFEDALTASFLRMENLAAKYKESASRESLYFYESDLQYKINIMTNLAAYVEEVYKIFLENFFIGGNKTEYKGDILDYNHFVDDQLRYLRTSLAEAGETIQQDIEDSLSLMRGIAFTLVAIAVLTSLVLMYRMLKLFSNRIKHLEEVVVHVKKGDFEKCLNDPNEDEISRVVQDMVHIFMELIQEINQVSVENDKGNAHALMDLDKFEGGYKEAATAINNLINNITATNERINFIFESIPLVLTLWDKDDNIIDFNHEVVRRYGLLNKEEYRERYFDFMPEQQPDGSKSKERVLEALAAVREFGRLNLDLMHQNTEKEPIPSEVMFFKAEHKGQTVILTCAVDLRSVFASQERERESAERMRLMFDATPLVIEYWDNANNRIDCNEAARTFYNLTEVKTTNLDQMQFLPERQPMGMDTKELIKQYLSHAFNEGHAKFEYVMEKDNKTIYLEVIGRRMKLKDNFVVVTYTNDITPVKEMLKERERIAIAESNSQAKSRFLATMSHEIRTPISAVLGISEIQLQRQLPPDIEEAFSNIFNSSSVLIGILNDILDLSKIEAGKMPLMSEKYDVPTLIQDVIQMHVVSLDTKKFKFQAEIDENLPRILIGDVLRIKQVLNNIMSNAFKYTENGLVRFVVTCDPNVQDGYTNIVAKIIDTGKGMTEEQIESLHQDEYMRFHEQEIPMAQGTGLGMPIVRNLVELMSATIKVESKVHVGTTVTIEIPQRLAAATPIGKEVAQSLAQFDAAPKRLNFTPEPMPYGKVLVVDDVKTNLYVATGLLELYELQVETCLNATDAINKIKEGEAFDIVFMDHMMPELNGIEATRILRDMGYSFPIIALTANALVGMPEEFIENGFDDFMAKPIRTAQLHNILVKYIKNRRTADFEPEAISHEDVSDYYSDPAILAMVREEFNETQKNAVGEIITALNNNETETARRIAHTVKTLAQMMMEDSLSEAAQAIEHIIAQGDTPSAPMLVEMESAMTEVLSKLTTN